MPRRTTWIDTHLAQITAAATRDSDMLAGSEEPGDTVNRGLTVTRIIINPLSMLSTTVAGAWGAQALHIGIGVSSISAFDVAASAGLPDPSVEGEAPDSGWLWKAEVIVAQNGANGYNVVAARQAVDVRSQRKLQQGVLFITMSNLTLFGTAFSVATHGIVRTLVKLP